MVAPGGAWLGGCASDGGDVGAGALSSAGKDCASTAVEDISAKPMAMNSVDARAIARTSDDMG
ncbi:MAG TPA: hypothetical protein VHL61_02050, partial [Luteimonas sp.]|nr:hypothetical protein [Luteimonas sp.]